MRINMSENIYQLYRVRKNGNRELVIQGLSSNALLFLYQVAQAGDKNPDDRYEIDFNYETIATNDTPFYQALVNLLDTFSAGGVAYLAKHVVRVSQSRTAGDHIRYICEGKSYHDIRELASKLYPDVDVEKELFNADEA